MNQFVSVTFSGVSLGLKTETQRRLMKPSSCCSFGLQFSVTNSSQEALWVRPKARWEVNGYVLMFWVNRGSEGIISSSSRYNTAFIFTANNDSAKLMKQGERCSRRPHCCELLCINSLWMKYLQTPAGCKVFCHSECLRFGSPFSFFFFVFFSPDLKNHFGSLRSKYVSKEVNLFFLPPSWACTLSLELTLFFYYSVVYYCHLLSSECRSD